MGSIEPGREMRVENVTRGRTLAESVSVADTWWTRLRGLLFRPELQQGEGLLIVPCNGVHTFGMSYPIDVLFVDEAQEVAAVEHELKPWRATGLHRSSHCALELPAGRAAETSTRTGDQLQWENGAT